MVSAGNVCNNGGIPFTHSTDGHKLMLWFECGYCVYIVVPIARASLVHSSRTLGSQCFMRQHNLGGSQMASGSPPNTLCPSILLRAILILFVHKTRSSSLIPNRRLAGYICRQRIATLFVYSVKRAQLLSLPGYPGVKLIYYWAYNTDIVQLRPSLNRLSRSGIH